MSTDLHLPELILKIPKLNDDDKLKEIQQNILEVFVEESLHLPAMFVLKILNSDERTGEAEKLLGYEKYFNMGDTIKIGFAVTKQDYASEDDIENSHLIDGEITAIEGNFIAKGRAEIVVRGYDVSSRLQRGRYTKSFQEMSDSDIVKKIAKLDEVNIDIGQVDDSGPIHDHVFQTNQTNMEFLRERAARIGFELFVQDNKLNFRKPPSSCEDNDLLKMKWSKDFTSFKTRVTSAEQVRVVEVRSWDYKNKKLISELADSESGHVPTETVNGQGSSASTALELFQELPFNKPETPKMTVVDQPILSSNKVFNPKEAETTAQALFDELAGEFVYADGEGPGNPNIRPGRVIKVEEMGDRFSGEYYVTETQHWYIKGIYITRFSVRGLRSSNLFTTLSPQTKLQPGQTLMVGIVTGSKDEEAVENWSRVKVKIPTLSEEHEIPWARVVGLGAGKERGFFCLPEVGDEVLVGFEHGNIHRPYIIGGVWNGKDTTVETVNDTIDKDGKVRLRTIKTRTGHYIQFVENDGEKGNKKGIYIKTVDGQELSLDDSNNSVKIKAKHIGTIKIEAIDGTIKMKAAKIDMSAAIIDMSAPIINMKSLIGPTVVNITGALNVSGLATMEGGVAITGAGTIDGAPLA